MASSSLLLEFQSAFEQQNYGTIFNVLIPKVISTNTSSELLEPLCQLAKDQEKTEAWIDFWHFESQLADNAELKMTTVSEIIRYRLTTENYYQDYPSKHITDHSFLPLDGSAIDPVALRQKIEAEFKNAVDNGFFVSLFYILIPTLKQLDPTLLLQMFPPHDPTNPQPSIWKLAIHAHNRYYDLNLKEEEDWDWQNWTSDQSFEHPRRPIDQTLLGEMIRVLAPGSEVGSLSFI